VTCRARVCGNMASSVVPTHHTWPERNYAAVDIFMCGDCDPNLSLPVLKKGFSAPKLTVQEIRRGIVSRVDLTL